MELTHIITQIDELKTEIEALRPFSAALEQRIMQKFRLEWNYHSNAMEGNQLTFGETKAFLLYGLTAHGKPFKDYLDIKGHNEAITYLQQFIRGENVLTEADIRELHKILLVESYEVDAVTFDGQPTKKRIALGQYKTMPNHVKTVTGAVHYYATPEETPAKMGDLMEWYRAALKTGELHPLVLAATFHHQFVNIHPFDDGNGRLARLLMNLILMQAGYVPVVIKLEAKPTYLLALSKADAGELEDFIILVGQELLKSLELCLRGARGEPIDELADLDKQIALLQMRLQPSSPTQSLRQRARLFDDLLAPLWEKLFAYLIKFEPFFKQMIYKAYYWQNEQETYLEPDTPTAIWEKLVVLTKNDLAVDHITVIFCGRESVQPNVNDLTLQLFFHFEPNFFKIEYNLDSMEDTPVKLMESSYDYRYTEEDITKFVLAVVGHIIKLVDGGQTLN